MNIKAFEAATGVKRTTIRFYEAQGLLKPAGVAKNGSYRVYGAAQIERVRMIRMAQTLGFSLKEIADLMTSWERGRMSPAKQRALIMTRLAEVREKQAQLELLGRYLAAIVDWMDRGQSGAKPTLEGVVLSNQSDAA